MTEFYTKKRIDNSRLVRQMAPGRMGDYIRMVMIGGVLVAGGLVYGWQHFRCLELGYLKEELKAERNQARELNQQLRLETAALTSPGRIEAIASRHLGLTVPVPGQVAPAQGGSDAVLASARPASAQRVP